MSITIIIGIVIIPLENPGLYNLGYSADITGLYLWMNSPENASIIYYQISIDRLPWWLSSKNPPANAADTGLIPGLGRSHMLQSKLNHNYSVCALELWNCNH